MTNRDFEAADRRSLDDAIVSIEQRFPSIVVDRLHPCLLSIEALTAELSQRFQRRSGPGGQHRNKTSSGVFLQHGPTGITAEATERRSQHDNRAVAIKRMRYQLSIGVRTRSVFDGDVPDIESEIRETYAGGNLKLGENNQSKPSVLALLLNDLRAVGGQPRHVSHQWKVSTSAIINLTKSHPTAFDWLNRCRQHHSRRPLK